jgi:RHS repeat-associated protein
VPTGGRATSTVIYVYDHQGKLIGEYSNTGAAIREYVWMQGEPLAVFTPNGTNPPNVFFLHNDHQGAPRVAMDGANTIRWRWLGEPFGTTAAENQPTAGQAALPIPLRMPGQMLDTETGLFYNWHRSYDSTTGRYIQSDPIGLDGGINTYAYVGGSPVDSVDPDGLTQRAPPLRPNPNLLSNAQANHLISQIQQINPNFRYHQVISAPGQGGYSAQDVQFLQMVLQRARPTGQGGSRAWPSTAREMDQYLGTPGVCRPDLPGTPGRSKIVWQPSDNIRITFEQHPYHPTGPVFHTRPHWHLDIPGASHRTFVPTEPMP